MKLISFIAISFLAITVSAKPHRSSRQFSQDETGSNSHAKSKLDQQYHAYKAEWIDLKAKYHKQYPDYAKLREVRDDAKAVLELLVENNERIRIYNRKNEVQTGLSLGSFYNLGILNEQNDDLLKEIKTLLAKLKEIKGLLEKLEGIKNDKDLRRDNLRVQRDELKDKIRLRESQCKMIKKIVQKHKHNQPTGTRVRKFINSHLPNAQIK
ncbi:hypothetical protein BASA83_005304 [Batrachochytrium salamandrivorans]|nr:hypothetical protein BASA83_005304 [Batrachochytrium salamandrivorans]